MEKKGGKKWPVEEACNWPTESRTGSFPWESLPAVRGNAIVLPDWTGSPEMEREKREREREREERERERERERETAERERGMEEENKRTTYN